MTIFRIQSHAVHPGRAAVEVLSNDGKLIAVVYALSDQHLRVISKHLDGVVYDQHNDLPCVEVTLKKVVP